MQIDMDLLFRQLLIEGGKAVLRGGAADLNLIK